MMLYPTFTKNATSNVRNDDEVLSRDSVEGLVAQDSESYRAVLAWMHILAAQSKESSNQPRATVDDIITEHGYPGTKQRTKILFDYLNF